MVNPIGSSGPGPIDAQRISTKSSVVSDTKRETRITADATPAARLARLGPPIDLSRVNQIRVAIADGSYTVNADRLAAAMMALDLPVRSA